MILFSKALPFVVIFGVALQCVSTIEKTGREKNKGRFNLKRFQSQLKGSGKFFNNAAKQVSQVTGDLKMPSFSVSEFKEVDRLISLTYDKYENMDDEVYGLLPKKASQLLRQPSRKLSETTDRKPTISAARIILALSLANGFVHPQQGDIADHVIDFTTCLATADDDTIATKLASYLPETCNLCYNWIHEYKKLRTGGFGMLNKNPVETMNLAMDNVKNSMKPPPRYRYEPEIKITNLGCSEDTLSKVGVLPKSRWERENVKPLSLGSIRQAENFIGYIKDHMSWARENARYNDVDQLIRFISESKGESLLDFYNNYKYRPQTSEDTAVFEWKFLERLQHKHVDVAELFYLISVEMDTPRDFASLDDFDPTKDPIDDRHFYLNHVAGALKFSIPPENEKEGKKTKNRIGFMIIDLNIQMDVPIILMEDGQYPHLAGCNNTFEWLDSGTALARAYLYEDLGSAKRISTLLYKFREPFCAYLNEIFKPNLMMPDHGMLARQKDGSNGALVNFQILPKSVFGEDHYFNILNPGAPSVQKIPFNNLLENATEIKNTMEQVEKELRISHELLWGKLVAVKLLIFDDEAMVEKIYKANEEMKAIAIARTKANKPLKPPKAPEQPEGKELSEDEKQAAFQRARENLKKEAIRTHMINFPHNFIPIPEKAKDAGTGKAE